MAFPLHGDRAYWLSKGCTQAWGNPNTGYPGNKHNGIDLGCMTGTAIYSAWKGKVVKADYDPGYGRHVRILHPDGHLSIYGHFTTIYTAEGMEVGEGAYLGDSGGGMEDPQRGASDGPHLHFEVRSNPFVALSNIDPIAWLDKLERQAEPMPALSGQVVVSASPWVRIREKPGVDHPEIGRIYTGQVLELATRERVFIDGVEWLPLIYWTARGTAEDPYIIQA